MAGIRTALTIAGTDPSGGAGIQADLKTFQEREVYGMSVLTSIVAQNTLGVQNVMHLPVEFIEEQLISVLTDISPDVIKTGMIATPEMMKMIAGHLQIEKKIYVMDPVMIAKSGDSLMNESSQTILRDVLIPLATVVTPNIPEAEVLLNRKIENITQAEQAAKDIVHILGAKTCIVKGGHAKEDPIDILYDGKNFIYYEEKRFETKHTHGTGCTFSAVIAAELAKGIDVITATSIAKRYITDAIRYSLELGKGNGPTNHWGNRLQGLPNKSLSQL